MARLAKGDHRYCICSDAAHDHCQLCRLSRVSTCILSTPQSLEQEMLYRPLPISTVIPSQYGQYHVGHQAHHARHLTDSASNVSAHDQRSVANGGRRCVQPVL